MKLTKWETMVLESLIFFLLKNFFLLLSVGAYTVHSKNCTDESYLYPPIFQRQ